MSKMLLQSGELVRDKNRFLAYMQHMAQTARPAAAKRLFELFTQQEVQRIKAHGCFQLQVGHSGIGGYQAPLVPVSERGIARLARPEARIGSMKNKQQKLDAKKGGG